MSNGDRGGTGPYQRQETGCVPGRRAARAKGSKPDDVRERKGSEECRLRIQKG